MFQILGCAAGFSDLGKRRRLSVHLTVRPSATHLEQINVEMLHISTFSFSRKMRFAVAVSGLYRLRTTNAVFKRSFAAVVGESANLTNGDSDCME